MRDAAFGCDACGQGAQPYKAVQAREYESVLLTKAAAEFWDPTGLPSPLPSHGWYQQALFGGARPRPDHAPVLITPLPARTRLHDREGQNFGGIRHTAGQSGVRRSAVNPALTPP